MLGMTPRQCTAEQRDGATLGEVPDGLRGGPVPDEDIACVRVVQGRSPVEAVKAAASACTTVGGNEPTSKNFQEHNQKSRKRQNYMRKSKAEQYRNKLPSPRYETSPSEPHITPMSSAFGGAHGGLASRVDDAPPSPLPNNSGPKGVDGIGVPKAVGGTKGLHTLAPVPRGWCPTPLLPLNESIPHQRPPTRRHPSRTC